MADRDREGYRIDGHWAHASGASIATHFTVNAVVRNGGRPVLDGSGAPRIRAFILPAADVEIVPTWHAVGLRATASHAFRVHDRQVPASHGFDISAAATTADGALYRFPFLPLAFVTLAANLAGIARSFLQLAVPLIRQHRQLSSGASFGESPSVQRLVHQGSEGLAAARARFYALLDSAWERVESGAGASTAEMDTLQVASLALAKAARAGVDGLYPYCGLHAADQRSEINRVWRDFHTATQHALLLA